MATTQVAATPADASVAAPGLGVQGHYAMEDFAVTETLGLSVNLANGNLVLRGQDLKFNGPGAATRWDRFYNSLSVRKGAFGKGWALTGGQDVGLEIGSTQITLIGQSGMRVVLTKAAVVGGEQTWTKAGFRATLYAQADGTYRLVSSGSRQTLRFSSSGYLTRLTDRNGVGLHYFYEVGANGLQRVASVTDAAGRVSTFAYNGADQVVSITDSANRVTKYGYDASGRLTDSTDPAGYVTCYYYDASGRLTKVETPRGVIVGIGYDTAGRVASITRWTGLKQSGTAQTTTFAYTTGQTVQTNPAGAKWTYTLDTSGRVTKVVDPTGVTRSQAWTANSSIASVTDPDGTSITNFTWDGNNNPTQVTLPTGASSSATYGTGVQTDLAVSVKDPAGNQTTLAYDSVGNQTSKTSGGVSLKRTYSKPGSTNVDEQCSGFAGQVCTVTDGRGNKTRFHYNAQGLVDRITPPAPLGERLYTYDTLGRLTYVNLGTGTAITYEYDVNDHVIKTVQGQTAHTPVVETYAWYDPDGNLSSRDSFSFGYDAQNRLQSTTDHTNATRTVGFDAAGNITAVTDEVAQTTRYTYNAANQVTSAAWNSVTCPLAGTANADLPSGCVKFGYRQGKLTGVYYPGNVSTTYTRDKSNRVTGIATKKNTTTPAVYSHFTYGYSLAGKDQVNVQAMTDHVGDVAPAGSATTYTYDTHNRLTKAVETSAGVTNASWSYAYDADGNRTSAAQSGNLGADLKPQTRTTAYNGADQITTINGSAAGIGYDPDGNETAYPGTGTVATRTNVQTSPVGDVIAMTVASGQLSYTNAAVAPDGLRQLLDAHGQKQAYNPIGQSATSSIKDNSLIRLFTLPTGEILGTHTTATGQMSYLHKDRLGSVVAITEDTGNKSAYYRYDPYGQLRQMYRYTTTAGHNPLTYTSAIRDWNTGLTRLGARWYDPTQGRFTTPDPSAQETNPYLYAAANPTTNTDPSGLSWLSAVGGGAFGTIVGSFVRGACGISVYCAVGAAGASAFGAFVGTAVLGGSLTDASQAAAGALAGAVLGPVAQRAGTAWMSFRP